MKLVFRHAKKTEIPEIVDLLMDDDLGKLRERNANRPLSAYESAFDAIDSDPNNHLMVVLDDHLDGKIVGLFQLTYIPSLTHHGGKRAQVEGVRVAKELRNQGIGRQMFEWIIEQAQEANCSLLQLTSDKARDGAHDFYSSLGFVASHVGYKLKLPHSNGD